MAVVHSHEERLRSVRLDCAGEIEGLRRDLAKGGFVSSIKTYLSARGLSRHKTAIDEAKNPRDEEVAATKLLLYLAKRSVHKGGYDDAKQRLQDALSIVPTVLDSDKSLTERVEKQLRRADNKAANSQYRKLMGHAKQAVKMGNFEEATDRYISALEFAAHNQVYIYFYRTSDETLWNLGLSSFHKARKMTKKALEKSGDIERYKERTQRIDIAVRILGP